jgi:two-component system OmpR family response regulator
MPRRTRPPPTQNYAFGDWRLDCVQRELVANDGVVVPLSTGEYNLLLALVQRPQLTLTRDQLIDLTQGRATTPFERSIDNQISRLRRKIENAPGEHAYIKTVWGGGYVFCATVSTV